MKRGENGVVDQTRRVFRLSRPDEFLLEVIEGLGHGVLVFDSDGRLRLWNQAASYLLGRRARFLTVGSSRDGLYQRLIRRSEPPRGVEAAVPLQAQPEAASPAEGTVEFRLGRQRWIRLHETRTPGEAIVWSLDDVTSHKQAEQALQQSQRGFRSVAEAAPVPLVISQLSDSRILYANRAFCDMFALAPEEASGQQLVTYYADQRGRELAVLQEKFKAMKGADCTEGAWGHEAHLKRSDGKTFWAVVRRSIVTYAGKECVIETYHDITDHRQAEKMLTEAKQLAEEANLSKTRFLAAASHDLRQTLQSTQLFVSILGERIKDPQCNEVVGALKQSTEALRGQLDSLLGISRLETGVVQPEVSSFRIGSILGHLNEEFRRRAEIKNIAFRYAASDRSIRSDPLLLETMLRNLLDNAVKYTWKGKILLGCRRHGEHLSIEVHDTGPGIPPEQHGEVFKELIQLRDARGERGEGLGLGLAIVKRLAGLLGHDVELASTVGRGSAFRVLVPLAEERPRPRQDGRAGSRIPSMPRATVLLIEDDRSVRHAMERLLQLWGHEPLCAMGYRGALKTLLRNRRRPDIVIADLRLADGQSGVQVVRKLCRRLRIEPAVLLITGEMDPQFLAEARSSGWPVLHKPVGPDDLKTIIHECISTPQGPPAKDEVKDSVPSSANPA